MKFNNAVLVIIPHLSIGGTEVQTLNLVRALTSQGYKVRVLCLYRHLPSVVKQYEDAGAFVYISSPQYNNPFVKIHYQKGAALIFFLFRQLKFVLSLDHYCVIHVQYMTPGATIILLLRYVFFQSKIIATVHTEADIYSNLRLVHFIQQHCVRAFTCITKLAEQSFFGSSQLYGEATRLKHRNHFTIYNALPVGFTIRREPRSFDYPVTIGVVSRLVELKGMDLVVPAFVKVKSQYPNTRLIVVGDGSLREKMQQQAQELKCVDIEWAGRQPQERLAEWYSRMDIVLMPSRSEGFGLTAIEAMANGCVVVASRTGGLPEVVRDGEVGLLHEPGSVDDMVDKITSLVGNISLLQRYSTAAIQYVGQYSFERYSQLFNDLYKRLI